jgi:ABC-type antimicrobial peptide transport system permease subunit
MVHFSNRRFAPKLNQAVISIKRTFQTSTRALRRNIMRSALTCLGIIIGIGAVIAMAEIGNGASSAIRQSVSSMGANMLGIEPDSSAAGGISAGAATGVTLTPEDADALRSECPALLWVAPSVDSHTQIVYGNRNYNPSSIKGSTPAYFHVRSLLPFSEGEPFDDEDVRRAAAVCVVGQTIVRELFGKTPPIGQEIRIKNVSMKVVGVLPRKGANMMGRDQDDVIIAPWTTIKYRVSGQKLAFQTAAANSGAASSSVNSLNNLYPGKQPPLYPQVTAAQVADTPTLVRFNDLDDIYVAATSTEEIPNAIHQITTVLRERHRLDDGDPDDFSIRNPTELSQKLSETTGLVSSLLLTVALISLMVGGVGIMNIMLVSVTERTREIGLRMAVGARGRDILAQFLTEALLLCLAGGIAGIGLGRGVSWAINAFLRWPTLASPAAIAAAVATSAIVGLVFGYYPAWKASRLDPIEALRYE